MGVVSAFLVLVVMPLSQARPALSSQGCPRLTTTARVSRQLTHPLDSGDTPSTISHPTLFRPRPKKKRPPNHARSSEQLTQTLWKGPSYKKHQRPGPAHDTTGTPFTTMITITGMCVCVRLLYELQAKQTGRLLIFTFDVFLSFLFSFIYL